MTLPAELRAEADRVVVPHRDAQGRATSAHQAHSFEVRDLLHRAADALEWPARFGCNGPEGTFWTDDLKLANEMIDASYDRDDWTVTDMRTPLPATPEGE